MKSASSEDERRRSHRKNSGRLPQQPENGATKVVRIGRLRRGAFPAKAKACASSQIKNEMKREVMEQLSSVNSSSRNVVFKKNRAARIEGRSGVCEKIIHERGHKNIVSAARRYGNSRKIITQIPRGFEARSCSKRELQFCR
jgi:hypothetical protein